MYRGFVGTFFSHCLSLLSSLWAIVAVDDGNFRSNELSWIRFAFSLVVGNSCLGLVRYGNSNFGYKLRKFHVVTLNLSTIVSFSIVEAVLHSIYSSPHYLSYILMLNVISLVNNLLAKDYRTKINLCDSFIAVNSFILCVMSFYKKNYFSVVLNMSYLFGYFVVGECGFLFDTELPSIDAYQYLTCFLNVFAVYALSY